MTLVELLEMGSGSVVRRASEDLLGLRINREGGPMYWFVPSTAHPAIVHALHNRPATLSLEEAGADDWSFYP